MLMAKRRRDPEASPDDENSPLSVSPEQGCFIIVTAREVDDIARATEPDPASNPSDDQEAAVLEDHRDDPVVQEITAFIDALSEDEQIDLVTLTWLGRDDYTPADWDSVREEAARAHTRRTAAYLLGIPMVGDFLEEGLSMMGYSCEEFEIDRL